MESQYTLEKTDDSGRPLAIVGEDGAVVFTFEAKDERFANEILDNLNAGRAWEPEPLLAVELVGGADETESLEDTDDLASSA